MSSNDDPFRPRRQSPWWKEPIPIVLGILVLSASLLIVFQDRIFPGKIPDHADKSALPAGGGGGFCDLPAPVKSTAYNPSTHPVP